MKRDRAIGIFDSGLGGLTIFKAVRRLLPKENIIYFGDSAHVPYGSKSKETVTKYSLDIARFLENKDVKMILIACNTASALSLAAVKKNSQVPVLGVIVPGAKAALKATKNKKIAVLGTEATVNSKAYVKELQKAKKNIKVAQYACPLFVPLIEEGFLKNSVTDLVIEKYLAPVKKLKADTIILGCTHYPVIKKNISKFLGGSVTLIDSAEEIAKEAKEALESMNLLKTTGAAKVQVYASDSVKRFAKLGRRITGGGELAVKEVKLK